MAEKKYIQVFVTADKKSVAEKMASELVSEKLAACVQIVPGVTSVYRWKKKLEKSREWLCVIKSRKSLFPELVRKIETLHDYTVPEIVAVDITKSSPKYARWLDAELAKR